MSSSSEILATSTNIVVFNFWKFWFYHFARILFFFSSRGLRDFSCAKSNQITNPIQGTAATRTKYMTLVENTGCLFLHQTFLQQFFLHKIFLQQFFTVIFLQHFFYSNIFIEIFLHKIFYSNFCTLIFYSNFVTLIFSFFYRNFFQKIWCRKNWCKKKQKFWCKKISPKIPAHPEN